MEVNKKEDVEAAQNEAKNYKLPERPSNTNEKNYKLDIANVDMKNVNPMEMESRDTELSRTTKNFLKFK